MNNIDIPINENSEIRQQRLHYCMYVIIITEYIILSTYNFYKHSIITFTYSDSPLSNTLM